MTFSNIYNSDCPNEELPLHIKLQRKKILSIDKSKILSDESSISHLEAALCKDGRYVYSKDNYDFHFYYSKNKVGNSQRLFVLFFAARAFEKKQNSIIFRDLPFFPRWSYSNFLDGDVLCIEDPMYYKYPDLHVGWMFGTKERNLLEIATDFIKDFVWLNNYKVGEVYLIGSSCGGYAALQIGARLAGCNVITINPQIYINNYKYYFNTFASKIGLSSFDVENDSFERFNTDKIILQSTSNFVIACNLLSIEDYNDQLIILANKLGIKLNYGVNCFKNIKIWLYQAESKNPHSTMEDNNLIYALLNLCGKETIVDKSAYVIFSDIWAKNFEVINRYNKQIAEIQKVDIFSQNPPPLPPNNFEAELRWEDANDKDKLLVICSHKNKHAFYKYKFDFNTLFLCDKSNSYFTLYAGRLTDYIKYLIITKSIRKVCFLGCSKGGFGAILLAGLLSKYCQNVEVRFCSFSPQTLIYPFNDNLYFPSYKNLITNSESNKNLKICLAQYGDLSKHIKNRNLIGHIFYSEFNDPDHKEQHRLRSFNIFKHPLPFSFHGTILAFTTDTKDRQSVRDMVNTVYKNSKNEIDLGASLPKDKDILVEEISSLKIPSLKQLIFDIFYDQKK